MENDYRDEYLAIWEIIVLSFILIVTIIGNFLVLFALYVRRYGVRRRKLTRMYFFMMHLSIADLITGFLNVLPQLAWEVTFRFQGGPILCKIVKYGQPLGNYLSAYILIATAIDRYHAICHPFNYCRTTCTQSRIMVFSAWMFSLILCVPQAFIFSYQQIPSGPWDCWANFHLPYGEQAYVTWFSTSIFLLPFLVLLYTYLSICSEIWRNTDVTIFGRHNNIKRMDSRENNRQPVISRARMKTIKQMITVVSLHVLTTTPFVGCELWAVWDPGASKKEFFMGPGFTILTLLSSLPSCVNPWIYIGFNRELRLIIKNYFKKVFLGRSMNFDTESSNAHSTNSSTRTTIITTMVRIAGSMYRGKSSRERSSQSEPEPMVNFNGK